MKYLLAALALAWATAAFAGLMNDKWPPDRYRGDATVAITFVSTYAALEAACGKAPEGWHVNGCYSYDDKTIYLPNPGRKISPEHDYGGEDFARIVSHELAHANGWPADHPPK